MEFKKFRFGLDLRNNKIINSNVDNPTQPNQIANKNYVDLGDKYDTQLALNQQNSTKFDWVTNINNNTIKEVLDKLLFTINNPTYKNPVLNTYKIYNTGLKSNVIGGNINGKLIYQVNNNSRTPTIDYKLVVEYNDNSSVTFTDVNNTGTIVFNFVWNNIKSIKLKQIFSPVTFLPDSNGDLFIDLNFASTYEFVYSFDLLEFIDIFNFIRSIYYKTNATDLVTTYITSDSIFIKNNCTKSNLIQLNTQATTDTSQLNNTLIIFHEELINKRCIILFKSNDKILSSLEINLSEKLIYQNASHARISIDNELYYCALLDLGKYSSNTQALISL